ncbi:hypothetical protein PR202_ga04170 [Eleusine coracana subsp. coracana]|uniref:Uncharacterized protein n=1 Tax=Eleusine coracana subsp. coracana TaxID=191504 RepID=A0AAV5BRB7_ELECO|nr:hypothetical protein PR202_ga04170 [Eleusine coracana subsp. coracana]
MERQTPTVEEANAFEDIRTPALEICKYASITSKAGSRTHSLRMLVPFADRELVGAAEDDATARRGLGPPCHTEVETAPRGPS